MGLVAADLSRLLYAGRLDPVSFVVWVGVVFGSTIVAILDFRRARRISARTSVAMFGLLVPWAALLLTVAAFTIGHGHPLAQYNDEGTFPLFRHWILAWPVLLLGALGSGVAAIVGLGWCAAKSCPVRTWTAAVLANVVTLGCVFANFPSA